MDKYTPIIHSELFVNEYGEIIISDNLLEELLEFHYLYNLTEIIEQPRKSSNNEQKQFRKILGLPKIKQVRRVVSVLAAITYDGRLLIINEDHPEGMEMGYHERMGMRTEHPEDIELKYLKKMGPFDYFLVKRPQFVSREYLILALDVNRSLLVISIKSNPLKIETIDRISDVKNFFVCTRANYIIMDETNLLTYYPDDYLRLPSYKTTRRLEGEITYMKDNLVLRDNKLKYVEASDRGYYAVIAFMDIHREIDFNITDMISSRSIIYLVDDRNRIFIGDYGFIKKKPIEPSFQIKRLLKVIINGSEHSAVESIDGDIYKLPKLKRIEFPMKLLDLQTLLIGRHTKPANKAQ